MTLLACRGIGSFLRPVHCICTFCGYLLAQPLFTISYHLSGSIPHIEHVRLHSQLEFFEERAFSPCADACGRPESNRRPCESLIICTCSTHDRGVPSCMAHSQPCIPDPRPCHASWLSCPPQPWSAARAATGWRWTSVQCWAAVAARARRSRCGASRPYPRHFCCCRRRPWAVATEPLRCCCCRRRPWVVATDRRPPSKAHAGPWGALRPAALPAAPCGFTQLGGRAVRRRRSQAACCSTAVGAAPARCRLHPGDALVYVWRSGAIRAASPCGRWSPPCRSLACGVVSQCYAGGPLRWRGDSRSLGPDRFWPAGGSGLTTAPWSRG